MDHREKAAELFLQGYNCAQSMMVAYCDLTGLTPEFAAKMASSFGGGMGRMREVCGAVSGMLLVLGHLYGYDDPKADAEKMRLYQDVQNLAAAFREDYGTILCRELLENPPSDPKPTARTAAFYQDRPCARFVATAAELAERYIEEHPLEMG